MMSPLWSPKENRTDIKSVNEKIGRFLNTNILSGNSYNRYCRVGIQPSYNYYSRNDNDNEY